MKQHISVEILENFYNTNYKKAEQIIFKIMSSIDFLPWGHEAETIAEQFNIGNMIEFFIMKVLKSHWIIAFQLQLKFGKRIKT